jgi:PAS domain S-box-containing protein
MSVTADEPRRDAAVVPGRPDHSVHFYEDEPSLIGVVADFLANGLADGQPAIVIATSTRTAPLMEALAAKGIAVAQAVASGQLHFLDAHAMLSQFMLGVVPDERLFDATVGTLIRARVSGSNGGGVRAYGEMVDVLWSRGQREAAIRLEEFWHRLAAQHPFALLCAYSMGHFYDEAGSGPSLAQVCRSHTYIAPVASIEGARDDRNRIAIALLERRAQMLEAEVEHRRHLEVALRSALSERTSAEAQHQRAIRHLSAEHAITRLLADPGTFAEVVPRLLKTIGELGEWQFGVLWIVDAQERTLRCREFWRADGAKGEEFEKETRRRRFDKGEGLPGRIWASGEPAWIEDVLADDNFPRAPFAALAGAHGAIGFPIRSRPRITGVLEFFSQSIRQPDPDLIQLFDSVGTQIGQFIERREADEVRDRLAAIVSSSDDAIVSKTLDGVITSWNRGAEDIFGFTAKDAVGRHITLIVPADRYSEENDVLARLRRGEKIEHYETVRQHKDGRLLNVSLTVSPVRNTDGEIVGASKVARDITDKKRAEERLRRSEEAAQEQVRVAQQALQLRDEFLSVAAHEMRNPINALQLQLVSLYRGARHSEGDVAKDWVCERLRQTTEDVGTLVRLVHNLLDVARITAGRIDLEPEPIEFSGVIEDVVARLGPQLEGQHIKLDTFPVSGRSDRLRFEQIVTNLISNAIKYGERKPIEVVVRADDERVIVKVVDGGIGIAPEQQARLFERFSRAVPRRLYGGFGLGLWIARETVRAMGGEITLESRPDAGSTFQVTLPRWLRTDDNTE